MYLTNRTIRPSSLSSYRDCPRRTAARMFFDDLNGLGFDLKKTDTSIGALIGSGTHEGAASILKHKVETGERGNLSEARDRAQEEFDKRLQAEGCIFDDKSNTRPTAQKQIDRMVKVYHDGIAAKITPIAVEERLICAAPGQPADAAGSERWMVSGQFDSIVREDAALRDLKTGTVKRSNGPQYGSYSMISRAHGFDIRTLIEDYLPRVRLTAPQPPVQSIIVDLNEAEHEALDVIDRLQADTAEFERRLADGDRPPEGAFLPNPQSMLCSDKYCPAYGTRFCNAHGEK